MVVKSLTQAFFLVLRRVPATPLVLFLSDIASHFDGPLVWPFFSRHLCAARPTQPMTLTSLDNLLKFLTSRRFLITQPAGFLFGRGGLGFDAVLSSGISSLRLSCRVCGTSFLTMFS